jgi:excinuclease ABC subunit A
MSFMPDVFVPCPACHGARFNRQTLAVKYRDHSIADVLAMSVDKALAFFDSYPAIHRPLAALRDVGLGYLALGQPSTTISGGEAQRIKLATELVSSQSAKTLYVLDEPTTGLHLADIRRLLAVLQELVDGGNSVLLIEHHLDVIKSADWVIELGPEGGEGGGQLIIAGTPEVVATCGPSPTGQWLRASLGKR